MLSLIVIGCSPISAINPNDIKSCSLTNSSIKNLKSENSRLGLIESVGYLQRIRSDRVHIGNVSVDRFKLIQSQRNLLALLETDPTSETITEFLNLHFLCVGPDQNPLFTGYYTPTIKGSLTVSTRYPYPVYGLPEKPAEFSRHQIDREQALSGQHLEIAYVADPVDLFFMQIQGSGFIELPDKQRLLLSYAGKNNYPYRAIGKTMLDQGLLQEGGVSMQTIKDTLRKHPEMQPEILDSNPSYVFFSLRDDLPRGNTAVPVIEQRSLAADQRIFSAGLIALVSVPLANQTALSEQLMFVHDTGGAIRGDRRFDIYFGSGENAEMLAGKMQSPGSIQFLIPR